MKKIEHYMENYTDYLPSLFPNRLQNLIKNFLVAQHYMEQLIMTDKNSIIEYTISIGDNDTAPNKYYKHFLDFDTSYTSDSTITLTSPHMLIQ